MNPKTLTNGAFFAGAGILTTIIVYMMGPESFSKFWLNPVLGLLLFGVLIFLGIKNRNETMDGFAKYGKALVSCLIIALSGTIISYAFDLLLFNVIDPEFMEQGKNIVLDGMMERFENSGMDEDQVNKILADTEDRFDQGKTASGMLLGLGFKFVAWGVSSLIAAAFVTKKQKEFV